jgi:hypothetical protein
VRSNERRATVGEKERTVRREGKGEGKRRRERRRGKKA